MQEVAQEEAVLRRQGNAAVERAYGVVSSATSFLEETPVPRVPPHALAVVDTSSGSGAGAGAGAGSGTGDIVEAYDALLVGKVRSMYQDELQRLTQQLAAAELALRRRDELVEQLRSQLTEVQHESHDKELSLKNHDKLAAMQREEQLQQAAMEHRRALAEAQEAAEADMRQMLAAKDADMNVAMKQSRSMTIISRVMRGMALRRLHVGFATWKRGVDAAAHRNRFLKMYIKRWFNRQLLGALRKWQAHTTLHTIAHHRHTIHAMQSSHELQRQTAAVSKLQIIYSKWQAHAKLSAWSTWQRFVQDDRHYADKQRGNASFMRRMLTRWAQARLLSGFNTWLRFNRMMREEELGGKIKSLRASVLQEQAALTRTQSEADMLRKAAEDQKASIAAQKEDLDKQMRDLQTERRKMILKMYLRKMSIARLGFVFNKWLRFTNKTALAAKHRAAASKQSEVQALSQQLVAAQEMASGYTPGLSQAQQQVVQANKPEGERTQLSNTHTCSSFCCRPRPRRWWRCSP